MTLYHLVAQADWPGLESCADYAPESLTDVGFIHLSTAEQLAGSYQRYYVGRRDLLAVCIDSDKLDAELRWDPVRDTRFPHLYGPLNPEAVVSVAPYPGQR